MSAPRLSLSEYRAQRAAAKNAANDVEAVPPVDTVDADDALAADVDNDDGIVGDTSDADDNGTPSEDGEVAEPVGPHGANAVDADGHPVITNRTDEDEEMDAVRSTLGMAPQRYPWRLRPTTYSAWAGTRSPNLAIALFDCTTLMDNQGSSVATDREVFFTDLFLRLRFYEGKRPTSAVALTQAWNAFVDNFNRAPSVWMERLLRAEERFCSFSLSGRAMAVHRQSRESRVPCCVGSGFDCPLCVSTSLRLTRVEMNDRTNPWSRVVPPELRVACDALDTLVERRRDMIMANNTNVARGADAPGDYDGPRGRAPTRDRSRTHGRDRGRPRATSAEAPRYLPRVDTLAIERENVAFAAAPPVGPRDQQAQPRSNVAGQTHPRVVEAEVGTLQQQYAAVQTELSRVQSDLIAAQSQVTALTDEVASLSKRATQRLETISQLQSENTAVSRAQSTMRSELDSLRAVVANLQQQHSKLEGDHKRVLGVLRENNLGPPTKRSRGSGKDEAFQHKK